MIDHCIAALNAELEEKYYRVYVTDALKAIVDNSARYLIPGVGEVDCGTHLTVRWQDMITPQEEVEDDPRTCQEIATGIWDRIRGET